LFLTSIHATKSSKKSATAAIPAIDNNFFLINLLIAIAALFISWARIAYCLLAALVQLFQQLPSSSLLLVRLLLLFFHVILSPSPMDGGIVPLKH
jgi:fatty acid desaturase